MLLAQISDFHVGLPGSDIERRYDCAARLERAVRHLPEPPACQLHLWTESSGLVSHTSYIDGTP